MKRLDAWVINNTKGARSAAGLEGEIPFAVWQRQWEVYDLTGDRQGSEGIAKKAEELSHYGRPYDIIAAIYRSQVQIYHSDFAGALATVQGLADLMGDGIEQRLTAMVYNQLGQACQSLSDFDRAIEYRQKAMDIFERMDDTDSYGNGLASLGMIHWKMGRYPQAMSCLEEAREIFERTNNQRSLAMAITNIANVKLSSDQIEHAQENYLLALAICQRIGDLAKQSSLHNNLGAIMFRQADYAGAMKHYQLGIKLDETLGNLTGQASKLNNVAVMQGTMGNHDQAMSTLEKALKIDQATGNLDGQMRKLVNISSLHGLKGNYQRALACVDQALDICRRINSRSYLAYSLSQKIEYLGQLGRQQEAKQLAPEAISLVQEVGNRSQLVNLYVSLARIHLETGQPDQALDFSSQATGILESQELFEANRESCFHIHSQTLAAAGRPEESGRYLKLAYDSVMDKVKDIPDQKERDGMISTNSTYAGIVQDWERMNQGR